jgi:succinyl-diaminopimelate desuccinylase
LPPGLAPLGFVCETIASGPEDFRVTNLWAKRPPHAGLRKQLKTVAKQQLLN